MNDSKDLLSIGEMAGLCRISVKTLRYYDKTGIIRPTYIDSKNNYRYYAKSQLPFIAHVRELRLKGISIADILKCFAKEENTFKWEKVVTLVDEKLAEISIQLEKLLKVQKQFVALKELYIETGLPDQIQSGNIKVKYISPRTVAFSRYRLKYESHVMHVRVLKLIHLMRENNLYHKGSIMSIFHDDYRFFDRANADIEVCWEVLTEKPGKYSFMREIPGGLYVSAIHKGDSGTLLNETYPILYDWIKEQNYQVTGPAIQIYLVSVHNAQSPEQFVTEVQVPVTKN